MGRQILAAFLLGGILLPPVVAMLAVAAWVLSLLGDATAAEAIRFASLTVALVWTLDLIGLVLLQAFQTLGWPPFPTR